MLTIRLRPWKWRKAKPPAQNGVRRRRFRLRHKLLIAVLILLALVFVLNLRFRPLLLQIAISQAKYISNIAITTAVTETMASASIKYGVLIYTEKAGDGSVAVLRTNITAINSLKAELTAAVQQKLAEYDERTVHIAVGTLIGSEFTFGRGPKIPVKIIPLGTVSTSLTNQFTSAGINQTKHQMNLKIDAMVSVIIPGSSTAVTVSNDFTIAETIIVGAVPDAYTNFEGEYDSGDIIDFKPPDGATK